MIDFEVIAPDDFYNLDEKNKEKYINNVKEEIKSNEILKKMENIVKRNVSYFRNDFYVHDLHLIKEYPGRFIWMTRETGTDLIPVDYLDKYMTAWYNAVKKVNKDFYYFDKKTLKKITSEEMEEIINKYKKD